MALGGAFDFTLWPWAASSSRVGSFSGSCLVLGAGKAGGSPTKGLGAGATGSLFGWE